METNSELDGIDWRAYHELSSLDRALAAAAETLSEANHHYSELIMARLALRELLRGDSNE